MIKVGTFSLGSVNDRNLFFFHWLFGTIGKIKER